MNSTSPAYGLWGLVLLNSAIFLMFAFSFFKPHNARDWRTFGAFAAFTSTVLTLAVIPALCALVKQWQLKRPARIAPAPLADAAQTVADAA